jgi:replicative superfamily II helicase
MNNSSATLLCVSALAGAGKTALAHCVIKAFLEGNRGSDPRRLILYTVPTRSLREEVVLELVKFKASSFRFIVVMVALLL